MNNWTGIGNLTKDPEVRYSGDLAICSFTVAITEVIKGEKKAQYIPCVCFGKLAENCEKYLGKGRKVGVQGSIDTGNYEKNGQKFYYTKIKVAAVDFLDKPQNSPQKPNQSESKDDIAWGEVSDEDIPF